MLIGIVLGCFAVGGLLLLIAGQRVDAAERRRRWVKYLVYFSIVIAVLGAARIGMIWLAILFATILVLGAREIAAALRRVSSKRLALPVWVIYGLLAAACLASLCYLTMDEVAYVYIVVAVFDGFSQVSGQLLGRHKLAPRLSPGKTIEGTLGGMISALGMATLAGPLADMTFPRTLETGLLICLASLGGDLAASWIKRQAGIKDYGRLLPGHGGVLDRFDSFLPALALCGLWLA
jgi:phosphatidate cytidylyltransferase